MNSVLPDKIADLILQGDKLGAIAAVRRELSCSLSEAKRIVDEFDQELGTLRDASRDAPPVAETTYGVPWLFHFFSLVTSRNAWGIPKALRLARLYRINVDYYTLAAHARAGGNPSRVMHEMCWAIKAGLQPDLMKLLAADLLFRSQESFSTWVKHGMREQDLKSSPTKSAE